MHRNFYKLGQKIKYKGQNHRITAVKFAICGVMYKLDNSREWISEKEVIS